MDNICIFEDYTYENFLPLTYSRPVFELRCGFKNLREKIEFYFPEAKIYLLIRDYLKSLFSNNGLIFDKSTKGDVLFVNGRTLMKEKPDIKEEGIYYSGNEIAFIYIKEKSLGALDICEYNDIERLKKIGLKEFKVPNLKLLKYPWDIIKENCNEIKREFFLYCSTQDGINMDIDIIGEKKLVYIGKDVEDAKNMLFDASTGHI